MPFFGVYPSYRFRYGMPMYGPHLGVGMPMSMPYPLVHPGAISTPVPVPIANPIPVPVPVGYPASAPLYGYGMNGFPGQGGYHVSPSPQVYGQHQQHQPVLSHSHSHSHQQSLAPPTPQSITNNSHHHHHHPLQRHSSRSHSHTNSPRARERHLSPHAQSPALHRNGSTPVRPRPVSGSWVHAQQHQNQQVVGYERVKPASNWNCR